MTRRRLGYIVWGVAFLIAIVPELLAAVPLTESQLPFPTISRTVGHLEALQPAWEILPTALVVLFMYALFRAPQHVADPHDADDERPALRVFLRNAAICVAVVAGVTVFAFLHWPNQYVNGHKLPNFEVAYCLYGTTFLLFLAAPTVTALVDAKHPYPSLVRTVVNLEQWIADGHDRFRRALAYVVGFVIVWGMVFLLLHLTLYPFPNITRVLNHTELTCGGRVATRWHPGCTLGR
jgi:hypothetical protein